jgi:two-component system nitrogen regulation response regulator GlnG
MKKVGNRVLVVDDEHDICLLLARLMKSEGLEALVANDGETALKLVRLEEPDVLLADINMPDLNGLEVLKRVKEHDPDLPVVMITAYAEIQGAVKAMKAGAHDYLAKPFNHIEVMRVVRRALAERELKCKLKYLTDHLMESPSLNRLMGPSDAIGRLIAEVNRVAKSDFSVIIQGETGAGKELVAQAIHRTSPRAAGPFIPVDCGAIPEALFESELFGHEKGAFTSAAGLKPGKFELAKDGTLFLDEISNMPLASQAKLLRALQDKQICRVGGTRSFPINVRLLAASNQDLADAVAAGSFRHDLLYRLNEFTIRIPPLHRRKEDILYLAKRFLDITNIELNKNVQGITESAIEVLLTHQWPGNVRQLRSTIRRAVLIADEVITESDFDFHWEKASETERKASASLPERPWSDRSLKEIVQQNTFAVEREVLVKALRYAGGNKAKAARLLRIDYKTMHNKVKQLGISTEGGRHEQ